MHDAYELANQSRPGLVMEWSCIMYPYSKVRKNFPFYGYSVLGTDFF